MSEMIKVNDDELDVAAAGQVSFRDISNNTVNNNGADADVIIDIGGLIGNLYITDSRMIIGIANNIDFNFSNNFNNSATTPTGVHMVLTGFTGTGVDGGNVITFQSGANDVPVAEQDEHTILSWACGDFDLTLDPISLGAIDWLFFPSVSFNTINNFGTNSDGSIFAVGDDFTVDDISVA